MLPNDPQPSVVRISLDRAVKTNDPLATLVNMLMVHACDILANAPSNDPLAYKFFDDWHINVTAELERLFAQIVEKYPPDQDAL
jgi:hypothetical protein